MTLRSALNEKPLVVAAGAAVVICVAAVVLALRGCTDGDDASGGGAGDKAFFSADDGASYFADDVSNIPPYVVNKPGDPKHGKVAWRARVVRCADGGRAYVAALEKYADADRAQLERLMAQHYDRTASLPRDWMGGLKSLLKKPGTGDKGWVRFDAKDPAPWLALARPTCPDGKPAEAVIAE